MIKEPTINKSLKARVLMSRAKGGVKGIILHDTAGTGKHNDTLYLANPGDGRSVSVDFTVERDGSIWQLNPDLDKYACAHAGRATAFKGLRNGAVTRACIGIEIVAPLKPLAPTYPDAQVRAVAALCAYLADRYKLESGDITTHKNVITDGSRVDPRNFPFDGLTGFWHYYWSIKGAGAVNRKAMEIKTDTEGDRTPEIIEAHSIEPPPPPPPPSSNRDPFTPDGAAPEIEAEEDGANATGTTSVAPQEPPTPPIPTTEVMPSSLKGRVAAAIGFIASAFTAGLGKLLALPVPVLTALIASGGLITASLVIGVIWLKNQREARANAKDIALIGASKGRV